MRVDSFCDNNNETIYTQLDTNDRQTDGEEKKLKKEFKEKKAAKRNAFFFG